MGGAAFMLNSVALMAYARKHYASQTDVGTPAPEAIDDTSTQMSGAVDVASSTRECGAAGDDAESDMDTASLASFAASEFSGVSLRARAASRLRHMGVPPRVVGLASA